MRFRVQRFKGSGLEVDGREYLQFDEKMNFSIPAIR